MQKERPRHKVTSFNCGLYRDWGGGILLKLALQSTSPRTFVLQAEWVFTLREHLVKTIKDAPFQEPRKQDDGADVARDRHLQPTLVESDYTAANSTSTVTGWTWHVCSDIVIVEFHLQKAAPEIYLLSPDIVFSLFQYIDSITTQGYLVDLKAFRRLTEDQMEQDVLLSEGYRLTRAFEHFARSKRLLDQNYNDLMEHLAQFQGTITNPDYILWTRRYNVDLFIDEALRLIHNFVAACTSLIDHSRVFFKRLAKESRPFPGYQEEVASRFSSDPLAQFVVGLRQYVQHYRLPGIKTSKTIEGSDVRGRILLLNKDLLCFSGWNLPARKFLERQDDEINLVEVLESYYCKIVEFHTWLNQEWNKTFWFELHEAELKRQALLAKRSEGRVAALRTSLAQSRPNNLSQLENLFSEVLLPEELHELRQFEDRPHELVRRAVRYTERRCFLPSDLKQQILELGILSPKQA